MTMRSLQDQATDIAVFVLSVALLGFVTRMVRDVTAEAMSGDKSPALLPATAKGELLVRYTGGPQRFAFPEGLEGEIRNFAGHQWVILDTLRNREVIRKSRQWTIARQQPPHLQSRRSPDLLPATTYTAEQIFARAKDLFGTTTSPNEAGYILPDGTMLDFSGRHYEPTAPISGPFRERMADHREIAFAWPEYDSPGGFEGMKQMMNWGAVRFSVFHETVVVNLMKPPTEPQIKAIKQALWYNPDAVLVVEVDTPYLDQIDYQEFTYPFSNWKAFIERTIALGRPTGLGQRTGLAPQTSTLLPQIHKPYREQAHQIIEDLQKAVDETKKADSIRRIERLIERIDTEILDLELITGLDDLEAAIEEYKDIEKEGLTPEEYREEKESAFEAIVEAAEGLDIDEDALEELEGEEIEKPPPVKLPVPNELRRKGIATLDRLIQDKQRDTRPSPSLSDARKAVYKDILNGFGTVQEVKEYVEGMPEDNVTFTARGDEIPFSLIRIIISDIERNPWLSPFRSERRPDISWQPPLMPDTKTTYYTISFQGDTTFKPGEIVSEQAFKAENERVTKLGLRPARGWVTSKGELLSWGNGKRPVKELEEYLPASIPRDDLTRIADKYGWWAAKLAQSVCPHNDVTCVEREARRLATARRARLE